MMTGVYPETHGIVNNELAQLGVESSPWHHMRSDVRASTIFDLAKEQASAPLRCFGR